LPSARLNGRRQNLPPMAGSGHRRWGSGPLSIAPLPRYSGKRFPLQGQTNSFTTPVVTSRRRKHPADSGRIPRIFAQEFRRKGLAAGGGSRNSTTHESLCGDECCTIRQRAGFLCACPEKFLALLGDPPRMRFARQEPPHTWGPSQLVRGIEVADEAIGLHLRRASCACPFFLALRFGAGSHRSF
jgi:hypothetical protein